MKDSAGEKVASESADRQVSMLKAGVEVEGRGKKCDDASATPISPCLQEIRDLRREVNEAKRTAARAEAEADALRRECDAIAAAASEAEAANDSVVDGLAQEVARARIEAESATAARDAALAAAHSEHTTAQATSLAAAAASAAAAADAGRTQGKQLSAEVAKLKAKLKEAKKIAAAEAAELRAALNAARQRSAEDQIELLQWAHTTRGGGGSGSGGGGGEDDGGGAGISLGVVVVTESPSVAGGGRGGGGRGGGDHDGTGERGGGGASAELGAAEHAVMEQQLPAGILRTVLETLAHARQAELAAAAAEEEASAQLALLAAEFQALRAHVSGKLEPELLKVHTMLQAAVERATSAESANASHADVLERERGLQASNEVGRRTLKPVESRAESAWYQRLKRKYDTLLSTFAFYVNLRRYKEAIIRNTEKMAVELEAGAYTRSHLSST